MMKQKKTNLDQFLGRTRSKHYNCYDFVAEVWQHLFDEDVKERVGRAIKAFSGIKVPNLSKVQKLDKPESPCIVVMQRFRLVPHVGIFIDNRVLHLAATGVEYRQLSIATMGFQKIRFYK